MDSSRKMLTLVIAEQVTFTGSLNHGFLMATGLRNVVDQPGRPFGFIAQKVGLLNLTYQSPEGTGSITTDGDTEEELIKLLNLAPNYSILLVVPPSQADRICRVARGQGIRALPLPYHGPLRSSY